MKFQVYTQEKEKRELHRVRWIEWEEKCVQQQQQLIVAACLIRKLCMLTFQEYYVDGGAYQNRQLLKIAIVLKCNLQMTRCSVKNAPRLDNHEAAAILKVFMKFYYYSSKDLVCTCKVCKCQWKSATALLELLLPSLTRCCNIESAWIEWIKSLKRSKIRVFRLIKI